VLARVPRLALAAAAVLTMAACTMTGTEYDAAALPADAVPARLIFDGELCRNSGTVEAFDIVWALADPAPRSWRGVDGRDGHVTRLSEHDALFIADDGTRLTVTTDPTSMVCFAW